MYLILLFLVRFGLFGCSKIQSFFKTTTHKLAITTHKTDIFPEISPHSLAFLLSVIYLCIINLLSAIIG